MNTTKQPNKSTISKHSTPWVRRHPYKTVSIALSAFLALWLLGAPQHSYYYVKCGGKMPVRFTNSIWPSFASGFTIGYFLPSDSQYYQPPYLWTTDFYCTEQQAINDGLVADPMSDKAQAERER